MTNPCRNTDSKQAKTANVIAVLAILSPFNPLRQLMTLVKFITIVGILAMSGLCHTVSRSSGNSSAISISSVRIPRTFFNTFSSTFTKVLVLSFKFQPHFLIIVLYRFQEEITQSIVCRILKINMALTRSLTTGMLGTFPVEKVRGE